MWMWIYKNAFPKYQSISFEKKSKNQVMNVNSRKANVTSTLVFGSTQGVARFQSGHYAFL